MRMIKFRATPSNGEVYYFSDISKWGLDDWKEFEAMKSAEILFEQYTGLKDKNGKEIYEGDILESGDDEKTFLEMVHYKNGGFQLNDSDPLWGLDMQYFAVVGNIHENPELLKEAVDVTKRG